MILTSPTKATIGDNTGVIVIGASDAGSVAQPRISVADAIVGEGDGYVDVPVTLSAPGQHEVTVDYFNNDGTAVAPNSGHDYLRVQGTLTFAPGETTKTVRIEILDDSTHEDTESFTLGLNNPTNSTITRGTGTIWIGDNDPAPK